MSVSSAAGGTSISGMGTGTGGSSAAAAGGIVTDVNASVLVGFNCAAKLTMGQCNTMVGYNAAQGSTSGNKNCVYGFNAARICGGAGNVYVGSSVATSVGSAYANVVLGADAAKALRAGSSNVVVGGGADLPGDASSAVAVGGGASAGNMATCVGAGASAIGRDATAIGRDASAAGDGTFSLCGRLRGFFRDNNPGGQDTYVVEAAADVLQLPGGCALTLCPPGSHVPAWAIKLEGSGDSNADLVLRSAAGASVRFGNEFVPGVLDFTGQHCCPLAGEDDQDLAALAGRLVVATGRYARPVSADDAVPVVQLSRAACDPRVFGVVSAAQRPRGTYRVGHLTFVTDPSSGPTVGEDDRVVTVNAAGEGGIWVCDEGGPLLNGDLVVSSSRVPGMAMRQPGAQIACPATAAKVTCDCTFGEPDAVDVGNGSRARLVGCVYRF